MTIRRKQAVRAETAIGFSFDIIADALHFIPSPAAPSYVKLDKDRRPTDVLFHQREINGDEADPNVTPPGVKVFGEAEGYGGVTFHVAMLATQDADIEVWAQASTGSGTVWLLIEKITGIIPYREYLVRGGYRPIFLRATGTANIAVGTEVTLRAAPV